MNKVFNYFKLWGNGFVQAFGPLFVISVSCLYALPILFIGEFSNYQSLTTIKKVSYF